MWAAHNGHCNTCKLLLKCGANINLQDTVSVLLNLQQFCMLFLWERGVGGMASLELNLKVVHYFKHWLAISPILFFVFFSGSKTKTY